MYDLIIIGGGPAAVGAGVYAARKKLKTLVITESFGGQSITSDKIENWIGDISISGFDLAEKLEKHLRAQESIEIAMPEKATRVEVSENMFIVSTCLADESRQADQQKTYHAKSIIVASGARRRRLGIPGEDQFEGKGVAFCSTCDAPLFAGKDVSVVGGGNAGLEAVVDLFPYAKNIYLLVRSDTLKGDPITQEEIKKNSKVQIMYNATTKEIVGEKFVSGLHYRDTQTNEEKMLSVGGVFVEIGSVPNSEMARDLVKTNNFGEIIIDSKTAATSHPGIFAAGDVTDEMYKQNNISVGDGITAALSAYNYLLSHKKESPASE